MDSLTTYAPTQSIGRGRVQRSTDGIVAGYIRALAGASSPAAGARAHAAQNQARRDACGVRPVRLGSITRARRALEAL